MLLTPEQRDVVANELKQIGAKLKLTDAQKEKLLICFLSTRRIFRIGEFFRARSQHRNGLLNVGLQLLC